MADFWIKVEKGTPDKPEILEIAAILGIEDPDAVTGKLIRVWSWLDSNSENGHASSVTNVLLDRVTCVRGFTDALVTVGWLEKTENGFLVPNFNRHLGNGAKKRASDAERKRKSRKCHSKSVTESVTKIGLEKSRVDKIKDLKESTKEKKQSVKRQLKPQSFKDFFSMYPAHRKSGTDAQAWKVWKSEALTDQDALDASQWLTTAAEKSPDWGSDAGGQFVHGITKFIRERIWLTPPPEQPKADAKEPFDFHKANNSTEWAKGLILRK